MTARSWTEIEPRNAVDIVLPTDDIIGPINELGEPRPWPWEPQQLVGASFGQYHCGYCGGMQMAGLPHLDWTGAPPEEGGPAVAPEV
jgi:hypothetical protein